MRNTVLALVIVAMATPAYAQFAPNMMGENPHPKTDVEVKKEQERDAGYRSGVSKIPDAKAKSDPWASVRGTTPAPGQNQSRTNAK